MRQYRKTGVLYAALVLVLMGCSVMKVRMPAEAAESQLEQPVSERAEEEGQSAGRTKESEDGQSAEETKESEDGQPAGETKESEGGQPAEETKEKDPDIPLGENDFFHWRTEPTAEQTADTAKNYIYELYSSEEKLTSMTGKIHLYITGTSRDLIRRVQVGEAEKKYTVTLEHAEYLLQNREFQNWRGLLGGLSVASSEDGSVVFTFTTEKTMDYSYEFSENTLDFQLFYDKTVTPPDNLRKFALNILKPEGVDIDSVSNEDLYEKKKFQVIIEGNYKSFFKKNPVFVNSDKVENVSVKQSGGRTLITVKTSSLQGYKIYERGDYFVVKIAKPRNIYSSIVVLDAGHGGKDSGALGHGLVEKKLTYSIIYTLMKDYFSDNAPDIKVYWTRKTDTFITLASRAAFAKTVGADIFISLHMNSASNRSANGTEVYYSTSNNKQSFDGLTSKNMAALFKAALVKNLNMKNRGVKSAGFYVIKHNTVPAILIELGFITGNKDYKKLKKASFQEKAADVIYDTICDVFDSYDTGR